MFIFTMLSLSSKLNYLYTYINTNYRLNEKLLCNNPGGVHPPLISLRRGNELPPPETAIAYTVRTFIPLQLPAVISLCFILSIQYKFPNLNLFFEKLSNMGHSYQFIVGLWSNKFWHYTISSWSTVEHVSQSVNNRFRPIKCR